MAVTAALIGGGAAVAGGALASSGSKKGSKGGKDISGQLAARLFKETEPLRAQTIENALGALMGETPETSSPITQARRSAISAEAGVGRTRLVEELTRAGLIDSSVGIAGLEDLIETLRHC